MAEHFPIELVNYDFLISIREDLAMDLGNDAFAHVLHPPFEIRQADLLVGKGDALRLQVASAGQAGFSPAELFDCIDQDVHELYCAIFDPETNELREDIAEPGTGDDVLYLQSIKVITERRGQKLGLLLAQRLREYFGGGCSVMALKAHPLQFVPDDGYDEIDHQVFGTPFAAVGDEAKEKLRTYWSQLGFRRAGDTDYMVFDMTAKAPFIDSPDLAEVAARRKVP